MLSNYQIALLLQNQYDGAQGVFDHDFLSNGDRCSIKYYSDYSVVADEGSHDFLNWFYNFQAQMVFPAALGGAGVEAGFDVGMADSVAQTIPLLPIDKSVYCIGHSRGAGRAHIRAARLVKLGYKVIVVTFGCPRPGDAKLAAILKNAVIWSYRNYSDFDHQDFVCDVPPPFPLLYVHPSDQIVINVPPSLDDSWGILARHHLFLYTAAMEKICASPSAS